MTVIYVDMLLALNLVIDYLLLCGCARVLQLPTTRFRLLLGAALGALSSLMILLPPMNGFLSSLYKFATVLLMVPLSFRIKTCKAFFKATLVMFVISALFAGVCSGICLLAAPSGVLVQSGIVYLHIPPLLLLALTTVSYGILCLYDHFTRRRMVQGASLSIEIIHGDTHVLLRTLFDSGHSLRDGFSGTPVIVVERAALGVLQAKANPVLAAASSSPIRYIPFSSIGGDGVLPSFRPKKVILYTENHAVELSGVWVAVCDRLGKGNYDALIGPDIANLIDHQKKETIA